MCVHVSGVIYGCVVPSAVEGEYCPWERELQQGLWLQRLSDEEDTGTFKGTRIPSPLPFPEGEGNVLKSRSHMRSFCVLFRCFTSSLKTDSVAVLIFSSCSKCHVSGLTLPLVVGKR